MTIGGVEPLAGEVGVAPELVRAAGRVFASGRASANRKEQLGRWTDGAVVRSDRRGELPESEYATARVEEIRRAIRIRDHVSQIGRSFSWMVARGPVVRRDLEIAVSVAVVGRALRSRESLNQLVGAVFGGIGGGMGGGGIGPIIGVGVGAFHLVGPAVVAIIPAWLGLTYLTARTVYSRITKKRARELED